MASLGDCGSVLVLPRYVVSIQTVIACWLGESSPGGFGEVGFSVTDKNEVQTLSTQIVRAGRSKALTGPVVNPPVWRASTILYDDIASLKAGTQTNADGNFFYGRRGTPTQWSLAEALTELEPGAHGTMLYPSGVAAIAAALLSVLKPGDHLLMVDSAYDPTRSLCGGFLKRFGIETSYYDPMIGGKINALVQDNTRAIFMESPGSLTFEVQDVRAIVSVAKARGITSLIDNTWATSLFFQPLSIGVDISVIAATKYIVGHSDVMVGAVTTNAKSWAALRQTSQQLGQLLSPDDAYLTTRGLRTLDVRMARHQSSALEIARWLETQPEVDSVLHPALPSCPGHDIWQRDFGGSSGLFSFILKKGGDPERAIMIDALSLFGIGYSWGGYESLALPVDPEKYRSVTSWEAVGKTVRLQIGLEHPADLIADLRRGLDAFAQMVS
jgi:cysteine-S-conjugate beta-lyase